MDVAFPGFMPSLYRIKNAMDTPPNEAGVTDEPNSHRKIISMHFDQTPIRSALIDVLPMTGCSYAIDAQLGDCTVTGNFQNRPVEQIIDALLWQCHLGRYIEEEVIRVSTEERLERQRQMLRQKAISNERSGQKKYRCPMSDL